MNAKMLIQPLLIWLTIFLTAQANWPQFRGPNANGLAEAEKLPTEWDEETNVLWKIKIPGKGWSSPVVWEDKVFVTTALVEKAESTGEDEPEAEPDAQRRDGERRRRGRRGRGRRGGGDSIPSSVQLDVYCLDRLSGDEIWSRTAYEGKPNIPTHRDNTYASETPATDGERLYVYFGMHGLYCYDLDGNPIWDKDLGSYEMKHGWGTSSSPVVHDGQLFVQLDNEEHSFIVALDAATGDENWRKDRDEISSWSTPLIWENSERTELVAGGNVFRSYDPKSGEVLWELNMGGGRSAASPAASGDLLVIGSENRASRGLGPGGLFAVKAGATGDITPDGSESASDGVAWSIPAVGPSMASPLIYDGNVYTLARRGNFVTCFDAETGEERYRERLRGAQAFWASPWAYDGKIFCQDDSGTTHVLNPGAEFDVTATNTIDEQFWASSAFADGTLLLRGVENLYCLMVRDDDSTESE